MYQQENTAEADRTLDSKARFDNQPSHDVKSMPERVIRSGYLVKKLFDTPENNLFNYVKFNLVNQHIQNANIRAPRIMDIGCGLQAARRFLTVLNKDITYFGIDYESTFQPDAVVDLNCSGELQTPMRWNPDVVMLLDVLEHLHEEEADLRGVVKHIAQSMPSNAKLIVTVPQMYRLDRFKLKHLHYPEHKIRLTQHEWRNILGEHFNITSTQGVGYLSVLPYLPMVFRSYTPDNLLGRLFNHLRSSTFEKHWLKPLDLFLSNTLGKVMPFKYWSNDILFVATARSEKHTTKS